MIFLYIFLQYSVFDSNTVLFIIFLIIWSIFHICILISAKSVSFGERGGEGARRKPGHESPPPPPRPAVLGLSFPQLSNPVVKPHLLPSWVTPIITDRYQTCLVGNFGYSDPVFSYPDRSKMGHIRNTNQQYTVIGS